MSSSNGSISTSSTSARNGGYSSEVDLYLKLNGTRIEVAQVGGGTLYFDEAVVLPAGGATLVIEIDGVPKETAIKIAATASASRIAKFQEQPEG